MVVVGAFNTEQRSACFGFEISVISESLVHGETNMLRCSYVWSDICCAESIIHMFGLT